MVVELGSELKAWATYPGGQSGNPISSRYDDRIPLWTRGELQPLHVPRTPDQLTGTQRTSELDLVPRQP